MRFHYFIALVFILQCLYLQERRKEKEVIKQKEGCAENVNGTRLSWTNLIILIQAQTGGCCQVWFSCGVLVEEPVCQVGTDVLNELAKLPPQ